MNKSRIARVLCSRFSSRFASAAPYTHSHPYNRERLSPVVENNPNQKREDLRLFGENSKRQTFEEGVDTERGDDEGVFPAACVLALCLLGWVGLVLIETATPLLTVLLIALFWLYFDEELVQPRVRFVILSQQRNYTLIPS